MSAIKPEDVGNEIVKMLKTYNEEVTKAIEQEIHDTANAMRREIRAKAPKDTGKYKKGFSIKTEKKDGTITKIIHNVSKPTLTHLLEFGHIGRDGKRVPGKPHIRPVEDKYNAQLNRRIEEIIKKGGK